MLRKSLSERQLLVIELFIIVFFCFVPLAFNNPYRINIFLSWEGAYRMYLGQMPFRLDLRPLGGHQAGPAIILVHGTPTLNTLYWTEDRSDTFCLNMAEKAGAKAGDVICFGHTHKPWRREIEGIHFVNTGSVGRPKDGDWRAGYLVLDLTGQEPTVEFVRVEYDIERVMEEICRSALPDDFAEYLRCGGKPGAAGARS